MTTFQVFHNIIAVPTVSGILASQYPALPLIHFHVAVTECSFAQTESLGLTNRGGCQIILKHWTFSQPVYNAFLSRHYFLSEKADRVSCIYTYPVGPNWLLELTGEMMMFGVSPLIRWSFPCRNPAS